MSIWTFVLNLMDLNIHATIKKNYIEIMPSNTPHQKFCFYHLPTRGRARIKLGDAWYVSNVSIIFYCSMLLYYIPWMLMGSILHFYTIFGTNLLTGGPAQNCCFCLFQSFAEKECRTESKRNETFGNVIFGTNVIQRTWTLLIRLQRIYNFLLLHAILSSVLGVYGIYYALLYYFWY